MAPDGTNPDRADPSELAETIADSPAIRPAARPARKPDSQAKPAKSADPALDDTAVDAELEDEAEGVDLNRIYDRPEAVAAADLDSLRRYDPEAGRTSVAVKVKVVTEAIRNSVSTPFGKLIITLPVVLLGVSLAIAAVTIQDAPFIIAASVVVPISLLLLYWRYQVWLGHKRYMYRLLESLGEDMTEYDPRKIYRKISAKSIKKRRR